MFLAYPWRHDIPCVLLLVIKHPVTNEHTDRILGNGVASDPGGEDAEVHGVGHVPEGGGRSWASGSHGGAVDKPMGQRVAPPCLLRPPRGLVFEGVIHNQIHVRIVWGGYGSPIYLWVWRMGY